METAVRREQAEQDYEDAIESGDYYYDPVPASVHEKVDRWFRRGSRDESEVEYELLEKLVMICHANPYWLFDPDCEAYYAEDDLNAEVVLMGDSGRSHSLGVKVITDDQTVDQTRPHVGQLD